MTNHISSAVESFAPCYFSYGSEENLKSFGKLQIKPYFGHYSGIWITFDVRKHLDFAGNHKIKVKIEGCRKPASIHLRGLPTLQPGLDLTKSVTRQKLKEICLHYVHSLKPPTLELKHSPPSLVFLCEKKVLLHLNEIDSSVLPSTTFSHLNPNTFPTQDVHVKIWFGSSSWPTMIERIKVKQGISIAELQWMLVNKLPVKTEPFKLDIYEYKTMEKLSEHLYITPNQVNFHCIVLSDEHKDSIIVSLVGQGTEQIKVDSSDHMTLNHFQAKIKEKFRLNSSSFIFIPTIFKNFSSSILMSAVLDKSTASLIDSRKRNFPIIDNIPLTLTKYEKLDMYNSSLSKLHLLSSNLEYVYEVTGPTIPIFYRSSSAVGKGEFSLICDRLHAVSINLSWSVRTLLKFVEVISHFPCRDLLYQGTILPHSTLLGECFTNCRWRLSGSECDIDKNIPKILTSCSYN